MQIAALVFIVGAVVGGIAGLTRGFLLFQKQLDKYCGVKITYDRNEVLYRLGFPVTVLDDSQKNYKYPNRRSYETNRKAAGDDPDRAIPAGKTVSDYFEWSYQLKNPINPSTATIYLDFDRATKALDNIDCVDFTESQHLCPPLASVVVGDSEERVRDKLGKPDRYELDGVTKTMTYDGVGVEFKLTKGTVYYLRRLGKGDRSQVRLFMIYLRSLYT